MPDRLEMERKVADAIVVHVCHCKPKQHWRGFPECSTARTAARKAVETMMPRVHCEGSNKYPAETVLMDVVPGVRPSATCIGCKRSFTLNTYDKIPEHES